MSRRSKTLKGLRIESEPQVETQNAPSQPPQGNYDDYTEVIDEGRRYKKRGKTTMSSVWNMASSEKLYIEVDKFGVPCTKEGGILGSFLGTVATNGQLAPLSIPNWRSGDFEPFRRKMLSIVKERFVFPPELNGWILKSINKKWRAYKSELKEGYYCDGNRSREEVEADIPEGVLPSQWPTLVRTWFSAENKRLSEINTANAKKKKNSHTCGRKSYGRRRKEMANELGHSPDRLSFYDATHKRKDGTYVDESTKESMEKAFSLQAERRSLNSTASRSEINEHVFEDVFGKEHNGRVRGLGLGPTPKSYFGTTFYDVGARWNASSQSHELELVKVQLNDITSKHNELSSKHEEMCGKYEDLAGKYEIVSNKVTAMDAFLSENFPQQWLPNTKDTNHQVFYSSNREKVASFYQVSTNSSNSSHDPYFS